MASAYLEDYVLQRYRTLNTARPRVEHLRAFLGGWPAETITADAVRQYQLFRRKQGAEAATINRETSALSRMFQLAIRRGLLERMPLFPGRLEENPPRNGFFEHAEYLKVRAHAPASYQDVLDFAYYSGWRRNEICISPGTRSISPVGSFAYAATLEDEDRPSVADLGAAPTGPETPGPSAADARPARLPSRWGPGPHVAHGAPRCVSASEGAAPPATRLSPHRGAESDPRRCRRTHRDAAHGSQDARGV